MSAVFPLAAIVGQDELIEALLVNCVAPEVGGVLIRGERGNAKTTAVRGLVSLLGGAPLVEVPLGATLDRLVGSLDLRGALSGEHRFEQGLLGRADGGLLYVDEINLLADHLVDAMLDAAATGMVRVERDAVSEEVAARFVLVGTMNAEEGELRPQLLDRFGLGVEVTTPSDPVVRAEIVRRRLRFEADPDGFLAACADEQQRIADSISSARELYPSVRLSERELQRITRACAELGIDGVRGDLVTARAARALAALDGVDEVSEDHVKRAAALALAHRRRRDPLDPHGGGDEEIQRAFDNAGDGPDDDDPGSSPTPPGSGQTGESEASSSPERLRDGVEDAPDRPANGEGVSTGQVAAPEAAALPKLALALAGRGSGPAGRRARSVGGGAGAVDTRPAGDGADDLSIPGTVLHRTLTGRNDSLREHVRAGREGAFLCLVVDASGSMGARRKAAKVKGAVLEVLKDAYARRDRLAVIAFRDERATVVVPPGSGVEKAAQAIWALPTGGRTPLAEGLNCAHDLLVRQRAGGSDRRSVALVFTDGRVADEDGAVRRAAAKLGRAADLVSVIDTEEGKVRLGLAAELAAAAGGDVHQLVQPRFAPRRAA